MSKTRIAQIELKASQYDNDDNDVYVIISRRRDDGVFIYRRYDIYDWQADKEVRERRMKRVQAAQLALFERGE